MFSRNLTYPRDRSFFLFGPRGTGKTTWVKSVFPDSIYIDLLEAKVFNDLLADPQRLEQWIPKNYKKHIVIDEVQRIPEILNEIHRLIEKEKYKFILTGSSPRKLKRRRAANLLAGRATLINMYPLTAKELGDSFNLEHSLSLGNLPSTYTVAEPEKYLESYVMAYLEQELKEEGLSRKINAFTRFLEAASFSQGSVLNVSEISRDCAVERKTVENYFSILEDLLIAYRLPVFTKKAKRRLITHSKFYFFDNGIFKTLRPVGPLDSKDELQGVALETFFLQELKAINAYLNLGYKIFYWRTANQIEVDFILYGKNGLLAFEITKTSKFSEKLLHGLKYFNNDYPMAKTYLIYGGDRKYYVDGVEVIPVSEVIKILPDILSTVPLK